MGVLVQYIKQNRLILWMMMVGLVVSVCACNCVITFRQVCETELLHLSSLTMNSLQRGQLHHRWTWANCLNAGKYAGKYPPTPPQRKHTPNRPPLLSLCCSLPVFHFTKENFTTEGVFCCSLITNVPGELLHPDKTRRAEETIQQPVQFSEKGHLHIINIWRNGSSMWKAVGRGHT